MILVGIGGFFGAMCRFYIAVWVTQKMKRSFPIATLFINGSGSFLLGVLASVNVSQVYWQLLATGFLGAYTTFSTFGYEAVQLVSSKQYRIAMTYVVSSMIVGIVLATSGFLLFQP